MNESKRAWILAAIVAIVAVPWGVAWWTSNHADQLALTPEVHGDLFTTELEADDFDFHLQQTGEAYHLDNHWWMLLVQQGDEKMCLNRLHATHQIHVALGKDADRVKRALVQVLPADVKDDRVPLSRDKDIHRLRMTPDHLQQLKAGVDNENLDFSHGVVFVVDPLGNVVMAFDAPVTPKEILTDMKRLLRGSHIG